jgi:hypothetical protein
MHFMLVVAKAGYFNGFMHMKMFTRLLTILYYFSYDTLVLLASPAILVAMMH